MSQFERLVGRVPHSWLCMQYRSHLGIGIIQTRPMYRNIVGHPENPRPYEGVYNYFRRDGLGLCPFTFVDAVQCRRRFEKLRGRVEYINEFEAEKLDKMLKYVFDLSNNVDLTRQIIGSAPYLLLGAC